MSLICIWRLDYSEKQEGEKMAKNKAVELKETKAKSKKAKTGLTYAQTLEARAQRGVKTHQKNFAVKKAKKKEMEGK